MNAHRIIGLLLAGLLPASLLAQHDNELNNQGAEIYVTSGAEVYIWGDMTMEDATGLLDNDGFIQVEGNLFSDANFQQRGTGTVRIDNSDVNTGQKQFIEGSYAVRGGTAQTGVDDGSFYNLELANSEGTVYLHGTGYVADVRNTVDFSPSGAATINRIITHDSTTTPANGAAYDAIFGMMNTTTGYGNFLNNTINSNGNMSSVDNGYIQGKLRRAISGAGGTYQYILGLEPAGAAAARGLQYSQITFDANTYDVVTGYFQEGSDNSVAGIVGECSGYQITSYEGVNSGEWMFSDVTGSGSGTYEVRIWPQDHSITSSSVYLITKDDAIAGTANDCGPSYIALDRAGFNGFAGPSEFGVAGSDVLLSSGSLQLLGQWTDDGKVSLDLTNPVELQVVSYTLEKAGADSAFSDISTWIPHGNDGQSQSYTHVDEALQAGATYQYRARLRKENGEIRYSPTIEMTIPHTGWRLYPNPVHSGQKLWLSGGSLQSGSPELEVYDQLGRLVTRLSPTEAEWAEGIHAEEWPEGVLTVRLYDGISYSVIRLIHLR